MVLVILLLVVALLLAMALLLTTMVPQTGEDGEDDEEAMRLARVNSMAGACIALGLRFCGSCSKPACDLLTEKVRRAAGRVGSFQI